jgi:phage terminase large subunit-like protein
MPLFENDFRRLRLNEWTQQQVRWLSIDRWDECRGKIDFSSLLKKPCYGGLDLSSTQDLTAFLLIFPLEDRYTVLPFFFCPVENIIQRSHRDKVMYDVWAQMGLLTPTPGNVIDYSFVEAKIDDCRKLYDLKEIAFDRYKANELVQHLQDKGIIVVPIAQNQTGMNSSITELEKLVLGKKLVHDGNPMMRWMCNNVSLKKNAGGMVMFDKEKSSEKIDGMVTLVMALDRAIRHPALKSGHLIILGQAEAIENDKKGVVLAPGAKRAEGKVFCPRCGENTEGEEFCAGCGRRRDLPMETGQNLMARATL